MGELLEALEVLEVELKCPICLCPMVDSCSLAGCGHIFCRACIEHGLRVSRKCPLCKQPTTRRSLRENDIPQLDRVIEGLEKIRCLIEEIPPEILAHACPEPVQASNSSKCAFCSGEESGLSAVVGKLARNEMQNGATVAVHEGCASWSPEVHFNRATGRIVGLKAGIERGKRQLCVTCGKFGATIRCSKRGCPRVYHLPCSLGNRNIVLNEDNYELWCPEHIDLGPVHPEPAHGSEGDSCIVFSQGLEQPCYKCSQRNGDLLRCDKCERSVHLFCHEPPLQGLQPKEKEELIRVASRLKTRVVSDVLESVTHVVTGVKTTLERPRRTGKLLKAMVSGKVIVTFNWVSTAAASLVPEWPPADLFELDGRGKHIRCSRVKMFSQMSFYLGAYKNQLPSRQELQAMITFGGGKVLTRYPARKDGEAYVLREDAEEIPRKKKKVALANRAYQVPEITPRWIMDKISGDD
ncbi:hypothetical protein NDN08_004624 [Rhodosorus marinus]|uniref:RING-type E3 ubiquitin transferase BRCA1 n=1 Tax=Rhodosorus marinus TaxID=101924 RepID=A0AAV8UR02_9RHOD|nr:hypothetical protein NDN08_004624 [Rhodosorus marinus]